MARTWFFSLSTTSSFWRKILGSSRSCTRIPTRAALSAYAGPIPRLVVPSLLRPEVALGQGVDLLVVRHDQVGAARDAVAASSPRPAAVSLAISASRTPGSTTTPLPITGVMWS